MQKKFIDNRQFFPRQIFLFSQKDVRLGGNLGEFLEKLLRIFWGE